MKFHHSLRILLGGVLVAAHATSIGQTRSGENDGGYPSQKGQMSDGSTPLDFQTDLFTGRFGYQVPMPLAPGRHGCEPTVSLQYNSANENGWCGVGWSMDFGYIERETKNGVPVAWSSSLAQNAYDDAKGFKFSLKGKAASLVNTSGTDYRAEIESGFTRFILQSSSNQWEAIDTSGNQYFFGQTSNSRMSNSKTGWSPNSFSGIFRWAISRIQTVTGDTVNYTYTNINGALYPLKITYNGHISGVADTHTVDFILGSRSDVKLNYNSGFRVQQDQRLLAVVHKLASGQVIWSNRLAYTQSPSTQRSLLASVTRYGTNLTSSLPPVTFNYTTQSFGFQSAVNWTNVAIPSGVVFPATYNQLSRVYISPVTGAYNVGLDIIDMDGDGLPDRVYQVSDYGPYTNLWVQHNNGNGFDNPVPFGPLSYQNFSDTIVTGVDPSNSVDWTALNSQYMQFFDINGDGFPDRVLDPGESYSGANNFRFIKFLVQLGNGSGFNGTGTSNLTWTNVVGYLSNSIAGYQSEKSAQRMGLSDAAQIAMVDVNGDGLPDRVMAKNTETSNFAGDYTNYWVQFNTGSGFSTTNRFCYVNYGNTNTPAAWGTAVNETQVRLIDLNGDGLPDRVMLPVAPSGGGIAQGDQTTSYIVEFNNGYGFDPPVEFGGIVGYFTNSCNSPFSASGDGTAGLQDTPEFALRDMNGDGLPDRVIRYNQCGSYTNWLVQFNQGTNFGAPVSYGPYSSQGQSSLVEFASIQQNTNSILVDINGDGIPDHVMSPAPIGSTSPYYVVELGKGPIPDLLNVISNGIGASMAVTYKLSTAYDNRESTNSPTSRRLLPFPVQTVSSVSVSDGIYPSNVTSYAYEGGFWSPSRREFHGFAKVTAADPLGMTNVHWFHQSGGRDYSGYGEYQDTTSALAKSGMEYRLDTIGSDGKTYRTVLNKVEDSDLGSGRHFGYVSQTIAMDYPAGNSSTYRATAQQFFFDQGNGNLTNTIDYGEIASSVVLNGQTFTDTPNNDTTYRATTYASLANTSILDKPSRTTLASDSAGANILRESLFAYDGSTGNLTQRRDRLCASAYVTNGIYYDTFNNAIRSTNEAGVVTVTVYDSSQTYPASQTIGGKLTSTYNYDARSGKLSSAMDEKGLVTANSYDAFLRLIETDISTVSNGTANVWLQKLDYGLGMGGGFSTNYVHVRTADDVDTSNGHETWTYTDGLGRPIQVRDEAETGSYRVTDTVYDKRGSIRFITLPYFSTGTAFTKPTATEMGSLRLYDPVDRLTNTTAAVNGSFTSGLLTTTNLTGGDSGSPVGSFAIAYNNGTDPWTIVTTDEAGLVHRYVLDAYGRTNQIVEVTSGGAFTSTLGWNLAGDLTNITDNANNQIQFAVNNLGQVVAMADPDMGIWQYQRDFAGRIRNQIDGDSNKIVFNYETSLGRLSSRQVYSFNGAFAYGVTNVYDTSDDANFTVYPGELYQTIDSQGSEKNGYDLRGRVVKTARYLAKNGNTYTNQFGYNVQSKLALTIYPNGGPAITNVFDSGGHLSQVRQVGGSGTTFYSAQGFNAIDQITGVNYGNGLATTYSYYGNSHRLQALATSGSKQSLSYTYDKVADVLSIADGIYSGASSAALSSVGYDDLHRLTSLTRPVGSTSFSYDSLGNFVVNNENTNAPYNYGLRMPHAVKSVDGQTNAYDACGNMMLRGKQKLAYDPENQLAYVVAATGGYYFGYDGNGGRLWKSGTNGLQVWIGDTYEEKGGKVLFHVFANGQTVCTLDSNLTVVAYYHADTLHSTSVETDGSQQLVQHYEYSAFGQSRYTYSDTAFQATKRFTGQALDDDTGLYYYGSPSGPYGRYYDPQLGRFIQADNIIPDIFDPQSYNRFAYCRNNPLRLTDPSGHEYWADVGGMFMGYYDAGAGVVKGTVFMVVHPVQTVQGVGTAIAHPVNTGKAIVDSTIETWNSGARGQGQVVGNVLIAVGTAVAPAAEAGNLSKVEQIANVGSKVEKTAAASEKAVATAEQAMEAKYPRVKLSKGTRSEIWERSKAPNGKVYDPSGVEIKPGEPWQAGHRPGHKFSDAQKAAVEQNMDAATWKAYQRDPDIYRPEKPRTNLGHQHESEH